MQLALCTMTEPNDFTPPRSPPCEDGHRAMLGNLFAGASAYNTVRSPPFAVVRLFFPVNRSVAAVLARRRSLGAGTLTNAHNP
jgi:hypothetical protein